MKLHLPLFLFFVTLGLASASKALSQNVLSHTIVRPDATVIINENYDYVGTFKFEMIELVTVERHLYVETEDDEISSMMVIQVEEVLEGVDFDYVWKVTNPIRLGNHDYQHGNFYFDTAEAIKNNPGKETDMTSRFMESHGFPAVDGWVSSRYARITDDEGQSELIIFYLEPINKTGHQMDEFGDGENHTQLWMNFSKDLTKRASKAFRVE